jgi:bacillithiol biosynthesis deacetylase BshB1
MDLEQISQPLDCLAIGAHPDDCEISAGGTLALMARLGRRVGILTLTRGESGTRGTPEIRAEEARAAASVLGVAFEGMLDLGDGDISNTQENRRTVVEAIRRLRPRVILTNGPDDRHPDHRRAQELVHDAVFLANVGGFRAEGARWLTEAVCFFYQHQYFPEGRVDWIVDVSETHETKMAALRAHGSQFAGGLDDADPAKATYIASHEFMEYIRDRSHTWGHRIGGRHGEPFLFDRPAHAMHPFVRLVTPGEL